MRSRDFRIRPAKISRDGFGTAFAHRFQCYPRYWCMKTVPVVAYTRDKTIKTYLLKVYAQNLCLRLLMRGLKIWQLLIRSSPLRINTAQNYASIPGRVLLIAAKGTS